MSIYVTEPPHEYLRVFDPVSGGTIVCANKTHISPAWIRQFVGKQTHTIDVTRRFTHDQFVGAKKVQEFAAMLVDYSCEMHKALMKTKRVIVYCKNGRSRSPCVILAFFLLRGMSRDHAVDYLRLAFQTQRPTVHSRSANFPNFDKFFNLTIFMENQVKEQQSWIRDQVVRHLGRGASLMHGAIGQCADVPSELQHLPLTAFIGRASSSSSSSSSSATRRSRRSAAMATPQTSPPKSPAVLVGGRHVQLVGKGRQGVPTNAVGVLVGKIVSKRNDSWNVSFADGQTLRLYENEIANAFSLHTRVKVNWHGSGEYLDGCVVGWDGGPRYDVWFDDDSKVGAVYGANISLSKTRLPKHFPSKFRFRAEKIVPFLNLRI